MNGRRWVEYVIFDPGTGRGVGKAFSERSARHMAKSWASELGRRVEIFKIYPMSELPGERLVAYGPRGSIWQYNPRKSRARYEHIRIRPPEEFDPRSFRIIDPGRPGHTKIIIGCPKGHWDPKRQRCRVGTRAQAILKEKIPSNPLSPEEEQDILERARFEEESFRDLSRVVRMGSPGHWRMVGKAEGLEAAARIGGATKETQERLSKISHDLWREAQIGTAKKEIRQKAEREGWRFIKDVPWYGRPVKLFRTRSGYVLLFGWGEPRPETLVFRSISLLAPQLRTAIGKLPPRSAWGPPGVVPNPIRCNPCVYKSNLGLENWNPARKMTRAAREFISQKIRELIHEGYPQKQAIAIAYSMARRRGFRLPPYPNPSLMALLGKAAIGGAAAGAGWYGIGKPIGKRFARMTGLALENKPPFSLRSTVRSVQNPFLPTNPCRIRRNPLLQVVGMTNPPRPPFREGQKIPIEQARRWVYSTGNRELIRQFEQAYRLQSKANRKPEYAVWRTISIGHPRKLEMVTAVAEYGKTPETIYKPPAGSKKGGSYYRHEWGEGNRSGKPVPVLAAAGGKALILPMGKGQTVSDWMRG